MAIGRTLLLGAAGIAAVTLVGACSGGGASGGGSSAGGRAGASTAPDVRGAATSTVGKQVTDSARTVSVVTSAKIRRVDITVEVARAGDVARQADRADAIATRYGGEVYGDDREGGTDAGATITIKVPPDSLTAAVRDLAALGKEKSRTSSTKDVTAEVVDVDTRVASLQDSITELQKLYSRPNQKLADVLALERELAQRQADLESLQAQQRALHAQTDTATVTLTLLTAHPAVHKKHHAGGFLGGLRGGWDAFVHSASAVATALGAAIPFLVLMLLVVLALRVVWPRLGTRRREPVPSGD